MRLPSLKFSSKRHIPILVLFGWEFYPWQVMNLFQMMRGRVVDADVIRTKFFGYDISLERHYYHYTIKESSMWEELYAPISVKDRRVLDVGAGCGETAAFYFSRGAKRVVAIEPNPQAFRLLEVNARANSWNLDAICDVFKLEHLSIPHDFIKIDCEGGESILLEYSGGELGPCVIESHSSRTARDITKKFHIDSVVAPFKKHPEVELLVSSR
jgi:SAM-dependent methyltransferase